MSLNKSSDRVIFIRQKTSAVAALVPALVNLYEAVYAEPPYEEGPAEVEGFRKRLPEEVTRVGFSLITAMKDSHLVGAGYGWTMTSGKWWSRADREPPKEVLNAEKFAVMEWIVHPSHRGQGIGSRLMRDLLADRPEAYATLASDPRSAARAIYQMSGWQQVGQTALSWGPAMDLLVIEISTIKQKPPRFIAR